MQTTLLSIAIAAILALVAALVAPLFIDWSDYRGEFEARASRMTGLEFHVTGPIDARILPTPTLALHGIEFGRPGDPDRVRAKVLRIEFALGSLVRGEWKIADASLQAPDFVVGLDRSGKLTWPAPSAAFDLDGVSIQKLSIDDGRAVLADAASGSRVLLDKLEFKGELRSLAGPAKGEGSFVVAGHHYPYRLSVGRVAEDGGAKVRLTLDPIDRPLTADLDLAITVEQGRPRFDGSMTLARPVGRADGGIVEPWRVSSRLKGDSAGAVLEQIEFQYGPDERPIKLRGDAKVSFGSNPALEGVLSSPQIDLDRILALPDETRRRPLVAIRTLAEQFSGTQRLPLLVKLGLSVESLTLAGATLQRVSGDLRLDGDSWDIESLDLRAPGISQVGIAGRLGVNPKGVGFKGRAKLDTADPRVLLAWLTDRTDIQSVTSGPLRLSGDVTLGPEAVAVDALQAEIDRMTVSGRLAYGWRNEDRPARLDAALNAREIDVDRIQALAKGVLGESEFDWPREGTLSLKTDRAIFAGVDARQVDVNVRIDATGIGVERLTIADFGGASLAVEGRIDTQSKSPRGSINLVLDARALDGVAALADKFNPRVAAELRRSAERFAPVGLRASLSVDPAAANLAAGAALAKFKIDGRAGTFRVALTGDAEAASDAFKVENLAALKAANLKLTTRLDADDARALTELIGLERWLVLDKRAGALTLAASGALNGAVTVEGQIAAGSFSMAGSGMVRLAGEASPMAALEIKLANASIRSPRPPAAGKTADLIPASLSAGLMFADNTVTLSDLNGTAAGTTVGGRLEIALASPMRLKGALDVGALGLSAVLAAALGVPVQGSGSSGGLWPADPFEALLPRLAGQVAIKSPRAALTPRLAARDMRAMLMLGDGEFQLREIDGSIAGGRLSGELNIARSVEGVSARGRIALAGVNAAEIIPGDGAVSGRLTLEMTAEGSGRSPGALVGSLAGGGTFKLEDGRLVRLDPRVFDRLLGAVDRGLPIDAARVGDWIEKALAGNALAVAQAAGAVTIRDGQARLAEIVVQNPAADLVVSGNANLATGSLDGRLVLSGPVGFGGVSNIRPEATIALRGPYDSPKRTIDVAALSSWLALRAIEQQSEKIEKLERRPPSANVAPGTTPEVARPAAPDVPTPADDPPKIEPPKIEPVPARPSALPGAARAESEPHAPAATPPLRPQPRPARPSAPLDLRPYQFEPRS